MAKKKKEVPCIVGLTRVSTTKQSLSGLSVAAQTKMIMEYVERYHPNCVNNVQILNETVSGGKDLRKRKVLMQAVELAKENNCKLVLVNVDRLARSTRYAGELMDTGVDFVFANSPEVDSSTAQGRMFINLMATMAEYERALIRDRTKKAFGVVKDTIKKKGRHKTKADPSKNYEGRWIKRLGAVDTKPGARAAAVTRIDNANDWAKQNRQLVEDIIAATGETSLRGIAKALTDRQVLTPRGNTTWGASQVKNLLDRIKAL